MRQALAFCALVFLIWSLPGAQAQERPETVSGTVVFFYYKDLAPAREFYEDTLGFEKYFDLSWVMIFRITDQSSVGIVLEGRGFHPTSGTRPVMLSIVTDDIEAWHDRLQAAQVPFISDLEPPSPIENEDDAPIRGFIVADPGGYTIEFFQWQNGEG